MFWRVLPLLLAAFPAFGQPITYRLDPKQSWVYVVIYNDPSALGSGFGHDHGIRAMDFTGTVVWDAADPSKCLVEISFPVTVLQPDPPGMRERAKLDPEGAVKDSSLVTIKENFLAKDQLDAARYPTISYKATSCTGTTGKIHVTGVINIHGTTKTITTHMIVTPTPTSFIAGGTFKARATDFGFKPFSNWGVLKNQDEMLFVIDVVGTPAS